MSPKPVALAIDDDRDILRILELVLVDEGYDVVTVPRSPDAVALVRERQPVVVLLDLMMPELAGLEVLRRIRAFSTVPVIILTANGSDSDMITTLDAGADGYLQKPFNLNELAARVRAVVRRGTFVSGALDSQLVYGTLMVDVARRRVNVADQSVFLTRNEWRLLEQLVRNPGRVLSHEELITEAWGPGLPHASEYLRVWMSRLRKKLTTAGMDPQLITTASGIGYAFALHHTAAPALVGIG